MTVVLQPSLSHYDYLIVGAGLTSAVFAHEAKAAGKTCLVIDRRDHIGGNIYTEEIDGINVHKYGAHIFHTSLKPVWEYVNRFAEFNNYINSPVAVYKDELYNMPFNMNTFSKMWGIRTPDEAREKIEQQKAAEGITDPQNLEEQALSLVGRDIFEKLVKGYTEKQWGRDCKDLPASIITRLPVRFTYDNNYFNDRFQGIPMGGYTAMVEKMFGDTEILLNTEFRTFIEEHPGIADRIIYCGPMGCQTGFYFLVRDMKPSDAIALVQESMAFIAAYEGEIPGASRIECGNYLLHDLAGAKSLAASMIPVLEGWKEENLIYEK